MRASDTQVGTPLATSLAMKLTAKLILIMLGMQSASVVAQDKRPVPIAADLCKRFTRQSDEWVHSPDARIEIGREIFKLANLGQYSLADLPSLDVIDNAFRTEFAAIVESNPGHYAWAVNSRVIWADPLEGVLAVSSSEAAGFHLTFAQQIANPTNERLDDALQILYERIGNAITKSGSARWKQTVGKWFRAHRYNSMLVRAYGKSPDVAVVVGDVPLDPIYMTASSFDRAVSAIIVGPVVRH